MPHNDSAVAVGSFRLDEKGRPRQVRATLMRHGERFMDNMDVLIDEFLHRLAHELKRKGHLTKNKGLETKSPIISSS
jgi:hypothetical protein